MIDLRMCVGVGVRCVCVCVGVSRGRVVFAGPRFRYVLVGHIYCTHKLYGSI